jgi:hypothetical protein
VTGSLALSDSPDCDQTATTLVGSPEATATTCDHNRFSIWRALLPSRPGAVARVTSTSDPTHAGCVPLAALVEPSVLVMSPRGQSAETIAAGWPLGGVERALGKVRFARLIHSGVRVLGGPALRAACGGNLSLTWLPRRVVSRVTFSCVSLSTRLSVLFGQLLPRSLLGSWDAR